MSANSPPENVTSPGQSMRPPLGAWRLLDLRERHRDRADPDREVDEEDRLPADAVGEHAADQRADRDRGAGDRAPHAERGAAVAALEGGGQQRQRGREHERAADALQRAREVEHQRRPGERAQRRGDGEDRDPDHEDPAAAEEVGERAAREQQRRERERVGVDHPLQVGEARVQRALDRRAARRSRS